MEQAVYTNGAYLDAHPTWHSEDSSWKARHILGLIAKHRLAPHTIAEIGCGAGEVCFQLYQHLPETAVIQAYDISPQAIALCAPRRRDRLHFVLGDLLEESAEMTFDLVLAIDVCEHVEDYVGFLRRLRLRGTHHLFHIPLEMNVQAVLRRTPLLNSRRLFGHLHYFSIDTALAALRDTGYEIVDFVYTPGSMELPSRTRKMKLATLPRKLAFSINQGWTALVWGGCSALVLTRSS